MLRMDQPQKINSRDNARIKNARAVRDGREAAQIFIEGWRLSEEAVSSNLAITEVFLVEGSEHHERHKSLVERLSTRNLDAIEISEPVSRSLSDTRSPQGIFIIAERPGAGLGAVETAFGESSRIAILLDRVNNPSNLGAIVRTAEAAGAACVFVSQGSADAFSPKALRASMGSAFRLPIVEDCDLSDVIRWAAEQKAVTTGATVNGGTPYIDIDWSLKRLLMFGSEANGIGDDELGKLDELIRIPMIHGVESLNLAVACGVILFEAKRQS